MSTLDDDDEVANSDGAEIEPALEIDSVDPDTNDLDNEAAGEAGFAEHLEEAALTAAAEMQANESIEAAESAAVAQAKKKAAAARRKTTAPDIIRLAHANYTFGIDQDGASYALTHHGHIVRPLKGSRGSLSRELAALSFAKTGKTASSTVMGEAMSVLEHECEQIEPKTVHLRVARHSDAFYIDLGDVAEHFVKITAAGWQTLPGDADSPVLFRRTALNKALPIPESGGDFAKVWDFVNVPNEGDRQVTLAWMVGAIILVGLPCPIFALLGEQGTAKTSAMRFTTALFDPTTAPVRSPPNDVEKMKHATHGSRVTCFDNLSSIPVWLSDAMCRVVTGEADVDRALYTNGDLHVISTQGVLGFTGITVGAMAGDLSERCVWGHLAVIPASGRLSERDLKARWAKKYPSMVGGLFDLIVKALGELPNVKLAEKPRMADFAEVLKALDLANDTSGLEHYLGAQAGVAAEHVETDPVAMAMTERIHGPWKGTSKELYALLPSPRDDRYWPTARGLHRAVLRLAPDLRASGWVVVETKGDPQSKRAATWTLEPPAGTTPAPRKETDDDRVARRLLELGPDLTAHVISEHSGYLQRYGCRLCVSLAPNSYTSGEDS